MCWIDSSSCELVCSTSIRALESSISALFFLCTAWSRASHAWRRDTGGDVSGEYRMTSLGIQRSRDAYEERAQPEGGGSVWTGVYIGGERMGVSSAVCRSGVECFRSSSSRRAGTWLRRRMDCGITRESWSAAPTEGALLGPASIRTVTVELCCCHATRKVHFKLFFSTRW